MQKLLIVCGPTATGKTDLGIKLAKKFNGEIISADSRQVYKGLDIITGKDVDINSRFKDQSSKFTLPSDLLHIGYRIKNDIPIWLLDIVEVPYPFNVGEYSGCATQVIEDIQSRNKLPIVLGGSGMYIRSVIHPYETQHIPPNTALRSKLEKLDLYHLQMELESKDPKKLLTMNNSDRNNPRRLIRAIEIASGKHDDTTIQKENMHWDILAIGLKSDPIQLALKIKKRVEKRLQNGAKEELIKIKKQYPLNHQPAISSLGFSVLNEFIDGKLTQEKVIEKWVMEEIAYSKRQMTWFQKEGDITWFELETKNIETEIDQLVRKWYTNS